ncbi:MAG: hypothetical protein AB1846_12815 [Chloroflexota bacterium]
MSQVQHKLSRLIALALVLLAALVPSSALAISLVTVTPGQITNDAATTIQVEGTQFVSGAVVSLNGYGDLSTAFVSKRALTAVVPAGVPAGIYTVTVTNPGGGSASLANGLTVSDPQPAERPLLVVTGYKGTVGTVHFGEEMSIVVTIKNAGQKTARNVQATFGIGDLIPRTTGGLVAVGDVAAGNKATFDQPMTVAYGLWGKSMVSTDMTLTYSDESGAAFSEKFTLVLSLEPPPYYTETPTPSALEQRPQLVISSYKTGQELLQPGSQFTLSLGFTNVGLSDARQIVMILGGGSATGGSAGEGTPSPSGGISGGSGEFTNFAPIGSSNVQSLGDLPAGSTSNVNASLVVNVSTNPGAYPLKISFAYLDENGATFNDDQVITLLVYSLPNVDVSFYRPPDPLLAGQPGSLPLQIVNIGRKSAILGNMRVEAEGASLENAQTLVGILEPGGFFTLDPTVFPEAPGTLELTVTVDYTDDFNQPRSITKHLSVDVMDVPVEPFPPEGGEIPVDGVPSEPETFWQKLWRFVLGLLGLDSAAPSVEPVPGETVPETEPPVIIPGGKG